jgi:hypothetical protein
MANVPFIPAVAAENVQFEEGFKSPVVAVHRVRAAHKKAKGVHYNQGYYKEWMRRWVFGCIGAGGCIDRKHATRASSCNCIGQMNLSEEQMVATVDYLYGFGVLEKAEQQTLLKEWINYGEHIGVGLHRGSPAKKMRYLLPGTQLLICKDALCLLLGLGTTAWDTLVRMSKNNLPPSHGLTGEVGNARDMETSAVLDTFFGELLNQAAPRATLLIRNLVRGQVDTSLRDEEGGLLDLPSHMTKRGLFNSLLGERGWKHKYDNRGRIIDRSAIEGATQLKAVSWTSFTRHWQKNHPKLIIAGSREDICNECFVYANKYKYGQRKKGDQRDEVEQQDPPEEVAIDEAMDCAEMVAGEELVKAAARHVEMAQQQRLLYQDKKQEAIGTSSLPPTERVLCFVADYAQNMQIPNFASEQPGATYYYAPMNAYVFGVVDASQDSLSAYIYTEDVAKKGGNNVASLLMHHIDKFLETATTGEPFKELNFIFDNCGGQNKNRHVLRLMHLLVKRGVATIARAIFLVRGHTKNDCDRLFNTMKKEYRKSNCFTPKDLIDSMRQDKVKPIEVGHGTFRDWDKLENGLIKAPTGVTNANHIFTVDINRNNGNSMWLQESQEAPETELVLVLPLYHNSDATFWREQQPEAIPPAGIQDIKWRELYKKWGAFIPEEKKKEWRYYNEVPPAEKLKAIAKQSKEARTQRKTRTRTVHNDDGNKKSPPKRPKTAKTMEPKDKDGSTGVI